MKTFVHKFSSSVSCTLQVADTPPDRGTMDDRNMVWDGDPKPKHKREYIRWMNEVNRQLADEWNKKIMQCFQITPNNWEFWIYEPGKPPHRCEDETNP